MFKLDVISDETCQHDSKKCGCVSQTVAHLLLALFYQTAFSAGSVLMRTSVAVGPNSYAMEQDRSVEQLVPQRKKIQPTLISFYL